MNTETLLLYIIVSFFYVLSPGPAVFLAITNGITSNMKTVAISSLANILGLFVLSSISMLGLGAMLLSSALLFMVVKVIGAMYLIYLGLNQFFKVRKKSPFETNIVDAEKRTVKAYFLESFFLAATNPKPILFFVALFPQFIIINSPLMPQFFILTGIFMAISFFILFGYGFIAKSVKKAFKKPSMLQWFHRATGSLLIFMGISLLKLKNTQA